MQLSTVEKDLQDGLVYAILGKANLDLAEFTAPNSTIDVSVPLECATELNARVRGVPHLKITIE